MNLPPPYKTLVDDSLLHSSCQWTEDGPPLEKQTQTLCLIPQNGSRAQIHMILTLVSSSTESRSKEILPLWILAPLPSTSLHSSAAPGSSPVGTVAVISQTGAEDIDMMFALVFANFIQQRIAAPNPRVFISANFN